MDQSFILWSQPKWTERSATLRVTTSVKRLIFFRLLIYWKTIQKWINEQKPYGWMQRPSSDGNFSFFMIGFEIGSFSSSTFSTFSLFVWKSEYCALATKSSPAAWASNFNLNALISLVSRPKFKIATIVMITKDFISFQNLNKKR